MALLAMSLAAVVAAFAAAVAPNRCGDDFQRLDRMDRIVTGDNQIARAWELFSCLIANYNIQAGAGMQSCGKRIVNQLPVRVFVPERNARDMQFAIADVADPDRPLDPAAGFHATEEG